MDDDALMAGWQMGRGVAGCSLFHMRACMHAVEGRVTCSGSSADDDDGGVAGGVWRCCVAVLLSPIARAGLCFRPATVRTGLKGNRGTVTVPASAAPSMLSPRASCSACDLAHLVWHAWLTQTGRDRSAKHHCPVLGRWLGGQGAAATRHT